MKNDRWGDKFVAHSIAFPRSPLHVWYNRSALTRVVRFYCWESGIRFFLELDTDVFFVISDKRSNIL